MKILLVGPNKVGKSAMLAKLRKEPAGGEEQSLVAVESFQIEGQQVTVFEVSEMSLIGNQANGADGIMLLVDPKDKAKLYGGVEILGAISSEPQLDRVPVAILIRTSEGASMLREVQSMMDLHRLRDREIVFKQLSLDKKPEIVDAFLWLFKKKRDLERGGAFEAHPKVVRHKGKFKEEGREKEGIQALLREPEFQVMSTVQQEKEYIRRQKEREKEENTNRELANFNKNKKKMRPYDIKPSPTPRIEPNLEFFLTDTKNQRREEASRAIMTDPFNAPPPPPAFVPKKLGIDRATEILDNQLFDFDREVNPILDVVSSKVLETAMLELEEEQELVRIGQLKSENNQKKRNERERALELIGNELKLIKAKEETLALARQNAQDREKTFLRLKHYQIAHEYLRFLGQNTISALKAEGFYPDEFRNDMATRYVDFLVEGTVKCLERRQATFTSLEHMFEPMIVPAVVSQRQPLFEARRKAVRKAEQRRVNEGSRSRVLHLSVQDENRVSTFTKNYQRVLDNVMAEHMRGYSERKRQLRSQFVNSEISEADYNRILKDEFPDNPKGSLMVALPPIPYGFTLSYSPFFSETLPYFDLFALAVDQTSHALVQHSHYLAREKLPRDPLKKSNIDESIVVDLAAVPAEVQQLQLWLRIKNLPELNKPELQPRLKSVEFGFENHVSAVPLHVLQLKNLPLADLIKAEDAQGNQDSMGQFNSLVLMYRLIKNHFYGGWVLETVGAPSKGMKLSQEESFLESVVEQARTLGSSDAEDLQEQLDQNEEREKEKEKEKDDPKRNSRQGSRQRPRTNKKLPQPTVVAKEKPAQRKRTIYCNKVSAPFEIQLSESYLFQLQKQANEFLATVPGSQARFANGFELHANDRLLTGERQLLGVRSMLGLKLLPKPEVQTPQTEEAAAQPEKDEDQP